MPNDQATPGSPNASPVVSVIMANFNGSAYIEAALRSALAQSLTDIEVIVADDASTDDSAERVAVMASRDSRLILLRSPANGGPGSARNLCLDAACGRWIAVMDSDDLMHPRRLEQLVAAAERDGADIVADDLLIFHEAPGMPPTTCLTGTEPFWIEPADYVRANVLFGGAQALGYLKPMIRADLIARGRQRYDTTLRIAEDYDFILRLLIAGARYRVYPDLTYFYRKHGSSISHRLAQRTLQPMLAAHDRLYTAVRGQDPAMDAQMNRRRSSILRALDYDTLVSDLKRRAFGAAFRLALLRPTVAVLLSEPVLVRLRWRRKQVPAAIIGGRRQVCIVSRQGIGSNTDPRSAALLAMCAELRPSGADLHWICPSPSVLGGSPVGLLPAKADMFQTIAIRGAVRFSRLLIASDARTWFEWMRRPVARSGLGKQFAAAMPDAGLEPWTRAERLFIARHARHRADLIIVHHADLADGAAYALRAETPDIAIVGQVPPGHAGLPRAVTLPATAEAD